MVSKFQWKPFWLATQQDPQNDWTATQNRVNYDVLAQAPLFWFLSWCHTLSTPYSACALLAFQITVDFHSHFKRIFSSIERSRESGRERRMGRGSKYLPETENSILKLCEANGKKIANVLSSLPIPFLFSLSVRLFFKTAFAVFLHFHFCL